MRAPRHQADVGARARELDTEITTDRAGAVNADFHGVSDSLESGVEEIWAQITIGFEDAKPMITVDGKMRV
jgi:hypothetical protein